MCLYSFSACSLQLPLLMLLPNAGLMGILVCWVISYSEYTDVTTSVADVTTLAVGVAAVSCIVLFFLAKFAVFDFNRVAKMNARFYLWRVYPVIMILLPREIKYRVLLLALLLCLMLNILSDFQLVLEGRECETPPTNVALGIFFKVYCLFLGLFLAFGSSETDLSSTTDAPLIIAPI